jgi:hypothetical protein
MRLKSEMKRLGDTEVGVQFLQFVQLLLLSDATGLEVEGRQPMMVLVCGFVLLTNDRGILELKLDRNRLSCFN